MAWERYLNLSSLAENDRKLLDDMHDSNARFLNALFATYPHLAKDRTHAR